MKSLLHKRCSATAVQLAMLAAGVAMIARGLIRGEAQEILSKAIIVCMECIGIG
ncbi:MAG: hypothetical protein FWH55_13400 [Oscillospiraceae bacterium]|nr:hypothetical protein [Oscillospiraceae bacterium]